MNNRSPKKVTSSGLQAVRNLIENHQMAQYEVAELTGYSPSTVSNIVRGKYTHKGYYEVLDNNGRTPDHLRKQHISLAPRPLPEKQNLLVRVESKLSELETRISEVEEINKEMLSLAESNQKYYSVITEILTKITSIIHQKYGR